MEKSPVNDEPRCVSASLYIVREIFHVDGFAVRSAVDALYGERFAFHGAGIGQQAANLTDVDKLRARHLNAHRTCERHHRVFVLGRRHIRTGRCSKPYATKREATGSNLNSRRSRRNRE